MISIDSRSSDHSELIESRGCQLVLLWGLVCAFLALGGCRGSEPGGAVSQPKPTRDRKPAPDRVDTAERPTPPLKLPFGSLDSPRTGDTVRGIAIVGGWALSESGIDEVLLYVDRVFKMRLPSRGRRPDVARVHPDYPDSSGPGFTGLVDFNTVPGGRHEIVVQARARSGATRDLGGIWINVAR